MRLHLLNELAQWGAYVSAWMHGCSCHPDQLEVPLDKPCVYKGRRFAEWSGWARHPLTGIALGSLVEKLARCCHWAHCQCADQAD